jgi:predicted site-specific integrase-resolvase
MADMVRPKTAAKQFGVSIRTLTRWADRGLIGRSRIDRVVYLSASDIQELIDSRERRRTVLPFSTPSALTPSANDDWRNSPLWREA